MTAVDPELDAIVRVIHSRKHAGRPVGQPGTANRTIEYKCQICHQTKPKSELFARQIRFINLVSRQPVRTRTIQWLCSECMSKDPDYNRRATIDSPGFRDIYAQEQDSPVDG